MLHKGLLLVGAPFLLGLAVVILLSIILHDMDKAREEEARLRRVSFALADMASVTSETSWAVFATIHPRMRATNLADPVAKLAESRKATYEVIAASKGTGPIEEALKEPIGYQFKAIEKLDTIRSMAPKEAMDPGALMAMLPFITSAQQILADSTKSDLKLLKISEQTVENCAARLNAIRRTEGGVLLGAFVCNALLAAALFYYFRKSILERLQTLTKKVALISTSEALGAADSGSDEIARLDAAFCAMDHSLREATKQETALFDNASDLICVIDEAFTFIKANNASESILGLDNEQLKGQALFGCIHKDDHQSLIQTLRQSMNAKDRSASFECRIVRLDGVVIETAWSTFWESCEGSWFCVVHDVSVYKNLERLKAQYFSFVSQHLTVPLQKISDSIEDLASEAHSLPAKASERIGTVKNNVARLVTMASQLMHADLFSANEKPELDYEKLDALVLLQRAASELEALAARRNVSISTIGGASLEADRGRIMQVLVNLLSNSVKYSPDGATVTMKAEEKEGVVRFSLKDEGRGVPAEFREAIFEKFKQVSAADGKRQAGTGLGLPICKQLVEWHGGRIGVESTEGKGSDFWFELPQVRAVRQDNGRETQKHPYSMNSADSIPSNPDPTSIAISDSTATKGNRTLSLKALSTRQSKQLKLTQQGLMLIGIPLLFELVFIASLGAIFLQSQAEAERESRERNLSYAATKLWFHYRQAALSSMTDAKDNLKETPAQLLAQLKRFSKGDAARLKRVERIRASCRTVEHSMGETFKSNQTMKQMRAFLNTDGGLDKLPAQFSTLRGLLKVSTLSREIQSLLKESSKRQSLSPQKFAQLRTLQIDLLIAGLVLNILVSISQARFFSQQINAKMIRLSDNCQRLAKEQPLNDSLEGDDEISHLDQVFHSAASSLIEAREKERSVLFKSKEVICSIDEFGKFIKVNPAATAMWQFEPAELIERNLLDISEADDRERVKAQIFNPKSSKFETQIVRKDGSICHVLWSISHPEGEKSIFCVAHDISAKKEAEKLTNEFLHMIGHDLRTPLSSIMGNAKMMEVGAFGPLNDEGKSVLVEVSNQCNNMLELINDLLDLEKLGAGMMQLSLSNLTLDELKDKVSAGVSALSAEKKVPLSFHAAEGSLNCDSDRLVQAVSNLLAFMIKQTPENTGINISFELKESNLHIAIENSANPIQHVEELFDRFKVFHRTGSLSLPIAKQIIENHGGILELESNNKGNIFQLRLPLEQAA